MTAVLLLAWLLLSLPLALLLGAAIRHADEKETVK